MRFMLHLALVANCKLLIFKSLNFNSFLSSTALRTSPPASLVACQKLEARSQKQPKSINKAIVHWRNSQGCLKININRGDMTRH